MEKPECEFNACKEDPEFLLALVNKYVKVDLQKDITLYGHLEAIDPLQLSIVLNISEGGIHKKVLIPGHTVLNITIKEDSQMENVSEAKPMIMSSEDILGQKHRAVLWFKKNLLPVTELGDNIVVGNATILPPYTDSDICTDNLMVASQLRTLMSKMPNETL